MYLPELVCASAGTPIDVDGAFGLPTSAHLSYESFDQCAPTGSVSTTPATTKLPPLNLYWSRRCEEAASASQLMDTFDDDDVFGAVYTDLAAPGGCGVFKEECAGVAGVGHLTTSDLAISPLHYDGLDSPDFYPPMPTALDAISPTLSDASRSSFFSSSESSSPFLVSPTQYQSFPFPPAPHYHQVHFIISFIAKTNLNTIKSIKST